MDNRIEAAGSMFIWATSAPTMVSKSQFQRRFERDRVYQWLLAMAGSTAISVTSIIYACVGIFDSYFDLHV